MTRSKPPKFEKYQRKSHRSFGAAAVTITLDSFVFSAESYRKFLKGYSFLELLVDREGKAIGFLPKKIETHDSYPIRSYRTDKSPIANVRAKDFIKSELKDNELVNKKTYMLEKWKDGLFYAVVGEIIKN